MSSCFGRRQGIPEKKGLDPKKEAEFTRWVSGIENPDIQLTHEGPKYDAWCEKQEEIEKAREKRKEDLLPGFDPDKVDAAEAGELDDPEGIIFEQSEIFLLDAVKNGLPVNNLREHVADVPALFLRQGMRVTLICSAKVGRLDAVEMVLQGITSTHSSNAGTVFELPQFLLNEGFLIASEHGHFEVVKTIARHMTAKGIFDVNTKGDGNEDDLLKNTALHHAVNKGDLRLVEYLLDCGASYDIENTRGETALTLALQSADPKIVEQIVWTASIKEVSEALNGLSNPSSAVPRLLEERMESLAVEVVDDKESQDSEALPQRSPGPVGVEPVVGGDGPDQQNSL